MNDNSLLYLINISNDFITQRNWWPYHNPKNGAMNICVEIGELAEYFISLEQDDFKKNAIKEELADVFFTLFSFSTVAQIDIIESLNLVMSDAEALPNDASYKYIEEIIIKKIDKFKLDQLKFPNQIVLSMVNRASQLADIFIWLTLEDSFKSSKEKHVFLSEHIAYLFAHAVYLSFLIKCDLVLTFKFKMNKNILKYPVESSSGEDYISIKDQFRGRICRK